MTMRWRYGGTKGGCYGVGTEHWCEVWRWVAPRVDHPKPWMGRVWTEGYRARRYKTEEEAKKAVEAILLELEISK